MSEKVGTQSIESAVDFHMRLCTDTTLTETEPHLTEPQPNRNITATAMLGYI